MQSKSSPTFLPGVRKVWRTAEKICTFILTQDRKYEPKQWKDHRLERYKQKWEENSKKIELEKEEKAERILHKHEQITQQNRAYKEKRDQLLQAVKHGDIWCKKPINFIYHHQMMDFYCDWDVDLWDFCDLERLRVTLGDNFFAFETFSLF